MTEKKEHIGIFDSGIGGLTVLRALKERFPHESYVYIGDTARLPYGTKSPETIIRYSESLAREILKHGVKAIVVACNTASAHALGAVAQLAGKIPVLGMIEPASKAGVAATKNNHIAVLATYSTVHGDVYARAIKKLNPEIRVTSIACQMLVALAEEGWAGTDVAETTLRKYIDSVFAGQDAPDTLILGCTHFPLFEPLLRRILGPDITLINSGAAAAQELDFTCLPGKARTKFFATDDPSRFAVNAARFFGERISAEDVELIDVR